LELHPILFNEEKYLTLNYDADGYHCIPDPGDLLCNVFNTGQEGFTGCIGDPEVSYLYNCVVNGGGVCDPGDSFCLCAGNMNNDVIIDTYDVMALENCIIDDNCQVPTCIEPEIECDVGDPCPGGSGDCKPWEVCLGGCCVDEGLGGGP